MTVIGFPEARRREVIGRLPSCSLLIVQSPVEVENLTHGGFFTLEPGARLSTEASSTTEVIAFASYGKSLVRVRLRADGFHAVGIEPDGMQYPTKPD
jgi:hypothetical protein